MRFGLSADERIKSRKDFELVFSAGKTVISGNKKIRARFTVEESEKPVVKIAPAVNKKFGIAVWRNRVKRLLKESYRLNKEILAEISSRKNITIKIVFFPHGINEKNNKNLKLNDIMPGVIDAMIKIKKSI